MPAITALFLYALLPIIRNTYTGINEVDANVTEAATAMGLSRWQTLIKVELPLAFPVILAGIRTATVINVGVATLAAYIAAGGLGEFIFGGISLNNTNMILAGAIPAALLAILFDFLLSRVQKLNLKKIAHSCLAVAGYYFIVIFFLCYSHRLKKINCLQVLRLNLWAGRMVILGLTSVYKLNIKNVVISDAVMYKAAYEKKLDVISGYSTDGRLKAFDLDCAE